MVELNKLLMKQGVFMPLPKGFLGQAGCILMLPHGHHNQNTVTQNCKRSLPPQLRCHRKQGKWAMRTLDAGSFSVQHGQHEPKQAKPVTCSSCLPSFI